MVHNFNGSLRSRGAHSCARRSPFDLASLILLVFSLSLALGSVPALRAQSAAHAGRRVISSEKPDYPPILKQAGIGGVVRLNAKVRADGTVLHVGILGGNPILAESAAKAVMNWKFVPAHSTTNEVVSLDFNAR